MIHDMPIQFNSSIAQKIHLHYKKIESTAVDNFKNIQVWKKETFEDKNNFNIKTFSYTYPSLWFSPIPISPFAKGTEEETMKWLKKHGLLPTEQVEDAIQRNELRYYTGYSAPLANYDYGLVFCKFLSLWLLFDDVEAEKANNIESIMPAINAIADKSIDTSDSLNPFVIAFKELGDEFERLGASRQWRDRLADGVKEWVEFAVQEAIAEVFNSNRTLEEVLDMRSHTIGVQPTTVLIERIMGVEIPDEILKDPLYQKCIHLISLICACYNDSVGVGKDIIQNQIQANFILFHFHSVGGTLADSCQAMLNIHDKAVKDFDLCTEKLLERVSSAWKEHLH